MLAITKSSRSIRRTLLYNEEKVQESKALFLDARNYWQERDDLSFDDKMHRLEQLTLLNQRSKAHCIHISVNFHPADQLTDKEMVRIAREVMKGIDLSNQPWLVYRHIDAGHPHMHIMSTNIRSDGRRIPNDLRSPNQLKKLCQRIESAHGLIPAQTPAPHQAKELGVMTKKNSSSTQPGKPNLSIMLNVIW